MTRERELPFSLTDHRWMDEVDASGGLIAVASGVFYFLESGSVQNLVDAMACRFPVAVWSTTPSPRRWSR